MSVSLLEGITRKPIVREGEQCNPAPHRNIVLSNSVQWEQFGPDGESKAKGFSRGNMVVSYGLDRLIKMLATDAGGASAYANTCVVGTSTTAVASNDASLGASTQVCGTFSRATSGASLNYLASFASDGNACVINEVGIFQTNTYTGSMIARKVLGTASINKGASDTFNLTYSIIPQTA
jgi:hypothetical protein